jgi:hypothetical protein
LDFVRFARSVFLLGRGVNISACIAREHFIAKNMKNQIDINLANGISVRGGAYLDRLDNRDFNFSEFGQAGVPFNWTNGVDIESRLRLKFGYNNFSIPRKNQGVSGSCGSQMGSYYAGVLEAFTTGVYKDKSARFIYAQKYLPGGGMYMRDVFDTLVGSGDPDSVFLPDFTTEEEMQNGSDITELIRGQAQLTKAKSYASVNIDIDTIAQAVDAGNGAGLLVQGSNNGTWHNTFPMFPKKGEKIWGHFLYAEGAVIMNGMKCIKVLNSWGPAIGDNGVQYLTEAYVKSGFVAACRTMIEIAHTVGWAANKYLTTDHGIAKTTANLNLRDVAGLNGKKISTIPCGTIVDVLGEHIEKDGYVWEKIQIK